MLRYALPMVVICALAVGGVFAKTASGIELARVLPPKKLCPARTYVAVPQGHSAGIPAPSRYPEYRQCSPWYGYGFGVPTYSWGWFGAKYRPAVMCHYGYYGDFTQWGYRRGY